MASNRRGYFIFGSIAVLALATVALLALGRLPSPAAVSAVAALNGAVAAAGVLIQRGTAAVRRHAATMPWSSSRPEGAGQYRDERPKSGGGYFSVETLNGNIEFRGSAASAPRPAALRHRAVTLLLAGLTAACVAAFAAGIVGILASGPMSPYEIALLVPGATSILVLITSWWWRVMDRSGAGDEAGTSRPPSGPPAADVPAGDDDLRDALLATMRRAGTPPGRRDAVMTSVLEALRPPSGTDDVAGWNG